jgi:iron complex transport system substrate-binding protein
MLSNIKPMKDGKVFCPLPHYSQSADKLDEIIEEVAAILHPELFSEHENKYFMELPER